MKCVLVTGGAGYIGSHACKMLAAAGYSPVVLDNLSTGHRWAVKWGPLVEGDLTERRLVRHTLERYEIDAVIHFAASASVGESMENPYKYLHDNVSGSLELLEAMRETRVRKVVFSSTCATYGMPEQNPISENAPRCPVSPYGESKLYVERALGWYARSHGFSWTALRYFNAAGADSEGQLGECHQPETHLIPLVVQAAMERSAPVRIMGTDYPTPDGTCIRDYVHVEDLAAAHIQALEYLAGGGTSMALNLGSGQGYSVRQVIEAVERVSGRRVPVKESARRAGDPPSLVADTRLAHRVLGWRRRYRDLDAIVSTAWQWHESPALVAATAS